MPDDTTQKTAVTAPRQFAVVTDDGLFNNLMDSTRFEHLQRVSKVFANSALVPEHFRGKEADCFIAVEMAMRLKLHPFNLMQSLYVVHGKPGIEAKMAIALINSSGIFTGPLQWTLSGEGMKRQATARAVHAKSNQVCEATVTMEMAKAEGWIDKSGSKWKTMPDIMLQYRSGSFFARLYCPEVLFGMQTSEELEDMTKDVTPATEQPQRRPTLKERAGVSAAEPIRGESRVVEDLPTETVAGKGQLPPQEAAGGAAPPPEASTPTPAATSAPEAATKGPAIPFLDVMGMAKKAKNSDQGDIVLDALNDPGYSEEERKQVREILKSKSYNAAQE